MYMFLLKEGRYYLLVYGHVMGDASDVKGYDRRTSELSYAALHMKQDRHYQYRVISL